MHNFMLLLRVHHTYKMVSMSNVGGLIKRLVHWLSSCAKTQCVFFFSVHYRWIVFASSSFTCFTTIKLFDMKITIHYSYKKWTDRHEIFIVFHSLEKMCGAYAFLYYCLFLHFFFSSLFLNNKLINNMIYKMGGKLVVITLKEFVNCCRRHRYWRR